MFTAALQNILFFLEREINERKIWCWVQAAEIWGQEGENV